MRRQPLLASAALVIGLATHPVQRADPPEAIQPAADRLLDHAHLVASLRRLASTGRVTIETAGTSAGGLSIPMAVVTAPGPAHDELRRQAARITTPEVTYRRLGSPTIVESSIGTLAERTRLPIVLAGASWGHEAAQVEGLVAATEHFAFDRSPDTDRVLQRVVLLIVPCMNPDGRERALAVWRRTPLAAAEDAVGNADGFMLNRDFIHQTQPEARAILRVTREWHAVAGVDLHEDMFNLGVAMPEVAFVPPFMPGVDVEEDPATRKAVTSIGAAIAKRWREAGYRVAFDPAGHDRFAPMPSAGSAQINPVAGSSGRLEFMWNIHSIPGLITESARTPGTQTWAARVDQKKLAAIAAAEAVASDPEFYARTVYERRLRAARADATSFVAIPHDQPAGSHLDELGRVVAAHGVLTYEAKAAHYDVIPLGQPEAAFVRHAILGERSRLNDLPGALGVRIVRSSDMDAAERERLLALPLRPIDAPPRAAAPRAPARTTAVAVYAGQGVDEGSGRTNWKEIRYVLAHAGFKPLILDADDVRARRWEGASAIVFGDGSAREIVEGWDTSAATHRQPWQLPSPPKGIGTGGVAALAAFVRDGGRLITIGRSSELATHPSSRLVDVDLVRAGPGIGEVRLRIMPAGRPLFDGVVQENETARAFLYAPPDASAVGYVFGTRSESSVGAYYAGANARDAEGSFADVRPLDQAARQAAIIVARAGRGTVVMFGVSPTFRAQWRSTFPLLINAVSPLRLQ